MAHPYKDGGAGAKAKLKRMLGQAPGTKVGNFSDAPATEAEIDRHLSGYDIRMPGGVEKSKTRLDRRASGGRTHKKGGHKTTVNVLVGGHSPQPTPLPVLPGGGGGGPPVPPPRPPMAGPPMPPPGMGGPGPMGPGGPPMPPPGMMPRKHGGKVTGDIGPASGKSKPLDKPKKGQSGWKIPRPQTRGQKNMPVQKNKP